MTTPELLPCPFCGGKAAFSLGKTGEGEDWHYLECAECEAMGPRVQYAAHNIAIKEAIASAWNTRTPTHAPNAGAVKVKPLDLSNLLKHAFMCGWYASETISSSSEYNWTEYDPTDNPAYARILAAIDVQPDPRDAQIERLVEAVKALEMWDAARGYPVPYRVRDPLRAALAAVKGGDA